MLNLYLTSYRIAKGMDVFTVMVDPALHTVFVYEISNLMRFINPFTVNNEYWMTLNFRGIIVKRLLNFYSRCRSDLPFSINLL